LPFEPDCVGEQSQNNPRRAFGNKKIAGLCTSQTGRLFYPQMTQISPIKNKKICVHL
jgi:hypothetical protein